MEWRRIVAESASAPSIEPGSQEVTVNVSNLRNRLKMVAYFNNLKEKHPSFPNLLGFFFGLFKYRNRFCGVKFLFI